VVGSVSRVVLTIQVSLDLDQARRLRVEQSAQEVMADLKLAGEELRRSLAQDPLLGECLTAQYRLEEA